MCFRTKPLFKPAENVQTWRSGLNETKENARTWRSGLNRQKKPPVFKNGAQRKVVGVGFTASYEVPLQKLIKLTRIRSWHSTK